MANNEESPSTTQSSNAGQRGEGKQDVRALLDGFVSLFDEYTAGIEDLLEEEGESERRAVVGILRSALRKQTSGLRDVLSDAFQAQDSEAQRLARQFLDASGLQGVITETTDLMRSAKNNRKTLWDWIVFIIELIKNILIALAELFPGLLAGVFDLIIGLAEIIEKIIRMIAEFLSSRAATNATTADRIMWSSLENMWNAKAARRRANAFEG